MTCEFRERDIGTIGHIYFQCVYTTRIKQQCKTKLTYPVSQTTSIDQKITCIEQHFKPKDKPRYLARLTISTCVWYKWQERNPIIFNQIKWDKFKVCNKIENLIHTIRLKSIEPRSLDSSYKRILGIWNLPVDYDQTPQPTSYQTSSDTNKTICLVDRDSKKAYSKAYCVGEFSNARELLPDRT